VASRERDKWPALKQEQREFEKKEKERKKREKKERERIKI
jgi:hypothetical protein